MKKFEMESERNEFKDLCIEVLPAIGSVEQVLKKAGIKEGTSIRIGNDGYLSLDIYNSKWRMTRYEENGSVKITYEYSEEIRVPSGGCLSKVSENLVEISLAFAGMQATYPQLSSIDSTTWKQQFVEWANEFKAVWDDSEDYLEEIEKFARKKIAEYAGLEAA